MNNLPLDEFAVDLPFVFRRNKRHAPLRGLINILRHQLIRGGVEPAFQQIADHKTTADNVSVGFVHPALSPLEQNALEPTGGVTELNQGHSHYGNWTLFFDKPGKAIALARSHGSFEWCLLMTFSELTALLATLDELWPELEKAAAADPDYCPALCRQLITNPSTLADMVVKSGTVMELGAA
ncbi:MAG: hypothetical protein HKM24_01495 [Gammaproteobacteria bacterium]|nr:hypothetical protein [Gammaproteobacteria bacterium]